MKKIVVFETNDGKVHPDKVMARRHLTSQLDLIVGTIAKDGVFKGNRLAGDPIPSPMTNKFMKAWLEGKRGLIVDAYALIDEVAEADDDGIYDREDHSNG